MNIDEIKEFALASAELVDTCVNALHKVASERDALLAKGDNKPVELNAEALKKAASAVHTALGSPSNVGVDAIVDCWKANPNRLVDTINKLASDRIENTVAGARIGATIQKRSSSEVIEADVKAADEFWSKYN